MFLGINYAMYLENRKLYYLIGMYTVLNLGKINMHAFVRKF